MKRFTSILVCIITTSVFVTRYTNINAQMSSSDTQMLARAVNGEARGEPYEGQVAVAAVILNRVKHSSFPNTISGVIYQPGQLYIRPARMQ